MGFWILENEKLIVMGCQCPLSNSNVKALKPLVPQNVTVFANKFFKKVIKLKRGLKGSS